MKKVEVLIKWERNRKDEIEIVKKVKEINSVYIDEENKEETKKT